MLRALKLSYVNTINVHYQVISVFLIYMIWIAKHKKEPEKANAKKIHSNTEILCHFIAEESGTLLNLFRLNYGFENIKAQGQITSVL